MLRTNAMKRWKHGWIAAGLLVAATAVSAEPAGTYWAVHGPDGQVGHLLGTIHSEDPRVLDFGPALLEPLTASTTFAMELVPNVPTLLALTEVMHYQDGTQLSDVIGDARFEQLQTLLAPYRMPPSQLQSMKPWAAMMTLSVPPPKSGLFLDFALSLRAAGEGLEVVGLETLDEQIGFLRDMPMEEQLAMLDQAIADFDEAEAAFDELLEIYLHGDLDALMANAEEQLEALPDGARAHFWEGGIVDRNHRMADVLDGLYRDGTTFAAVGALHLPGDDGLLALLRQRGWRLEALPNPFAFERAD